MNKFYILISMVLVFSCSENANKNTSKREPGNNSKIITTEQYLVMLMDSLSAAQTNELEEKLLNKIWEFSNPEIHPDSYSLSLSVIDFSGKQVANNLSAAIDPVKATLTISKNNIGWTKSITFNPQNKDNLFLLMKE